MKEDERKKLNSKETPKGRKISSKAEYVTGLTEWPGKPFMQNPDANHILLARKQEDLISCLGRKHPHVTVTDFNLYCLCDSGCLLTL
jgi:hypothetical protein